MQYILVLFLLFLSGCNSSIADINVWTIFIVSLFFLVAALRCFALRRTDKRKQALEKSRDLFTIAFNEAPIGIALVGTNGDFLEVNPQLCKMCGYDHDDLITKSFQDITHPDDLLADLSNVQKMIAGEIETYSMPKRYIHKNGSIVWIQLSVSSKKKDGKVDFFISQIEDITDRKRIETEIRVRNYELENIKLELENFAHVVSHDLKAPLRAIHNLTQWLEEDLQNLDASAIEKMHLIQDRSQRMSDLIDGILEYSRVGRSNVENSIISVSACIEDAIKLLQPHEFEITYDEMPTITMNKTRLIQVFSNLLNNAISHHHNPEHGKCHISCTEDEEFYTFYVKDNGPGIDEKYHHKIFEMFTTLHTKDSNKGVGAGLAQTKKIVEHRGGKIWVESVDKSGSTFIFTIPKEVIVHESI